MKFSLKLHDDFQNRQSPAPTLKAKIPISIFNQPFISSLTTTAAAGGTTAHQHLSFSLVTNFASGPSFRLNYTPTSTTTESSSSTSTSTSTSTSPFSFSLKSGLGLFGSPRGSPLVFSAHFSLSPTNPNAFTPSFFLHFKPQFGNFSLHKTTSSSNPSTRIYGSRFVSGAGEPSGSSSISEFANVSVSNEPSGWQDLKLEPRNGSENGFSASKLCTFNGVDSIPTDGIGFVKERDLALKVGEKGGLFTGIAVNAKTVLPVMKRVMVDFRWGVNFPSTSEIKMPYLTLNKIGIERVEKMKEVKRENFETDVGDLELLKGMCFWMRRDMEILEKENKELKQWLEEMRMGFSARRFHGISDNTGKKVFPYPSESFGEAKRYGGVSDSNSKKVYPSSNESSGEFEKWRSKRNGNGNGHTELKKSVNQSSDLESELQKAIKAASS